MSIYGRLQPEGEEREDCEQLPSADISLSEVILKMRERSAKSSSQSREASSSSRASNFLPKDDSIYSNLSELAASECSELSQELSAIVNDSFAEQTIISLADIEQELSELKSSMHDIDNEYERYASQPNPYLLKTTFTDISIDSEDSPTSPQAKNITNVIKQSKNVSYDNLDYSKFSKTVKELRSSGMEFNGEPYLHNFSFSERLHGWRDSIPACLDSSSWSQSKFGIIGKCEISSRDASGHSSLPSEHKKPKRRSSLKFISARSSRNASLNSSMSDYVWRKTFFSQQSSSTETSLRLSQVSY